MDNFEITISAEDFESIRDENTFDAEPDDSSKEDLLRKLDREFEEMDMPIPSGMLLPNLLAFAREFHQKSGLFEREELLEDFLERCAEVEVLDFRQLVDKTHSRLTCSLNEMDELMELGHNVYETISTLGIIAEERCWEGIFALALKISSSSLRSSFQQVLDSNQGGCLHSFCHWMMEKGKAREMVEGLAKRHIYLDPALIILAENAHQESLIRSSIRENKLSELKELLSTVTKHNVGIRWTQYNEANGGGRYASNSRIFVRDDEGNEVLWYSGTISHDPRNRGVTFRFHEKNVYIREEDPYGAKRSYLHDAVQCGKVKELSDFLIALEKNILPPSLVDFLKTTPDHDKKTVFDLAFEHGQEEELIGFIRAHGIKADKNVLFKCDGQGRNFLTRAIKIGKTKEVLGFIHALGIEITDDDIFSPIHGPASIFQNVIKEGGCDGLDEVLKEFSILVTSQHILKPNQDGDTILHYAAYHGRLEPLGRYIKKHEIKIDSDQLLEPNHRGKSVCDISLANASDLVGLTYLGRFLKSTGCRFSAAQLNNPNQENGFIARAFRSVNDSPLANIAHSNLTEFLETADVKLAPQQWERAPYWNRILTYHEEVLAIVLSTANGDGIINQMAEEALLATSKVMEGSIEERVNTLASICFRAALDSRQGAHFIALPAKFKPHELIKLALIQKMGSKLGMVYLQEEMFGDRNRDSRQL